MIINWTANSLQMLTAILMLCTFFPVFFLSLPVQRAHSFAAVIKLSVSLSSPSLTAIIISIFCSCWSCQSTMLPKSHVQVHRSRKRAEKKVPEVGHHFRDKVWSGRHGCLVAEDLKAAYGSCSGYKQLTHTPCHHTRAPAVPLSTHCNNSTSTRGIFPQVLFHPF